MPQKAGLAVGGLGWRTGWCGMDRRCGCGCGCVGGVGRTKSTSPHRKRASEMTIRPLEGHGLRTTSGRIVLGTRVKLGGTGWSGAKTNPFFLPDSIPHATRFSTEFNTLQHDFHHPRQKWALVRLPPALFALVCFGRWDWRAKKGTVGLAKNGPAHARSFRWQAASQDDCDWHCIRR